MSDDDRPAVRGRRNRAVVRLAIRSDEAESAIVKRLNHDLPFVDAPMVESAERHEVRQLRLAAILPMPHVVPVHVTLEAATGKATALVP